MYILYGIHNCSTVKKAKDWLQNQQIEYQFHDYRQQGLTADLLDSFEVVLGWQQLLNKKSTRWRQLNDTQKSHIDKQTALQYMLKTPTLIKRPILSGGDKMLIGFTAQAYQDALCQNKQ